MDSPADIFFVLLLLALILFAKARALCFSGGQNRMVLE